MQRYKILHRTDYNFSAVVPLQPHTLHVWPREGHALRIEPSRLEIEPPATLRYRAWQPPSPLHPTIGIHSPLSFGLIDTWNGCALGGCIYPVVHPGGCSYDSFPVNAMEAEARRHIRVQDWGHTAGSLVPPAEQPPGEFPHTLDLRRRPFTP